MFREESAENIVFSAYGTGDKPAFYGSPENGAGTEKWSLKPGTDKKITLGKASEFLYDADNMLGEALGWIYPDYKPHYDILGKNSGFISGHKASEKFTVEYASMIAVRLYDQRMDLNNYRYYLVK